MRFSLCWMLVGCLACLSHGLALAQGDWEFIGPDAGYLPQSFFVSQHAIYLGLAEEDGTGLGLYRYWFDLGEWELFAWDGYKIFGVTVWGESDENILLIRDYPGDPCVFLRSTDGGDSWNVTQETSYAFSGLSQAPSDTSHVIAHFPTAYSTDGGWFWGVPSGDLPWGGGFDVSFDPADALIVYLTGLSAIEVDMTYKSTDGGITWDSIFVDGYPKRGIEVQRGQPDQVMTTTAAHQVDVTTNAGEDWSTVSAPFRTRALVSPPWLPGTFYVAGSDGAQTTYEAWRTGDLGQTWFPCGSGLPDLPEGTILRRASVYLEAHPTEPVLYAALEGSGVWRWDVSASSVQDPKEAADRRINLITYPNPSTGSCQITCFAKSKGPVTVAVVNASGRIVRHLLDGPHPVGDYSLIWDGLDDSGREVPAGVYLTRIETAEGISTGRVVLAK